MKKKIIIVLIIILCVSSTYILYTHIHKETETLYSLPISKYYNNFTYSTIIITRTMPSKNQENPQVYMNYRKKSKKILDYLNQFKLTEINRKEAFKNKNTKLKNIISDITFNQNLKERNDDIFSMLTIKFFDNSIIEIIPYFENYKKDYQKSTNKYYKIDNDKIDFNYVEKLLDNKIGGK